MRRLLDMVLTEKGLAAISGRPNPLGPPRPVRCLRCRHELAECTCYDEILPDRS